MKAKIMVVELKKIIKTVLFILLAVALILTFIFAVYPKFKKDKTSYNPGTYKASLDVQNQEMEVIVTVDKKSIVSIELNDLAETQEVFYPLMEPTMEKIAKEIVETQSLDIESDVESQATTGILLKAIESALEQAKVK